MNTAAAIATESLTKTYAVPGRSDATVAALRGVTLSIAPGSFSAIVGPSGCGKSTLLHCTAGLDRATSGKVHLVGTETTTLSGARLAAFRARNVGFIFQDYNLISSLSASDNVALPGQLRGQSLSKREVREALENVGLAERATLKPHQLSGGEKQRVAIARVLAARPPLIFADEPTGALDIETGASVLAWLRQLAADGCTVLMVTHDVNAAALAGHVIVMNAGQVVTELRSPSAETVTDALRRARQVS